MNMNLLAWLQWWKENDPDSGRKVRQIINESMSKNQFAIIGENTTPPTPQMQTRFKKNG